MSKTGNSPAPDIQIHKDNMKLAVINIRPSFHKSPEQETRMETASRLYEIFKKYV